MYMSQRKRMIVRAPVQSAVGLVSRPIQDAANRRGHGPETACSAVGGGLGAMLGSFGGPLGVILGASLGGLIGYSVGSDINSYPPGFDR
jgi:hypothetical protein